MQGWDEFVEDVLNEFDPSFLTEEEARQPPKPNSETAQLAAYAIAASMYLSISVFTTKVGGRKILRTFGAKNQRICPCTLTYPG